MMWSKLSDEFKIDDIGARLLANLAKGIYSHEAVLREYVQNAADAYEQLGIGGDVSIQINVEGGNCLTIQDQGIGMDEKAIREAKKIAVSAKGKMPMSLTGFRGIGIWAGFQACDKLVIVTTKKRRCPPVSAHGRLQGNPGAFAAL
jgi:HSP90 family molecular chaperone